MRPLELTQDMGYITVGDKIDPNDWRDNPRRSGGSDCGRCDCASAAVRYRTILRCGNIILLHDGGGNRSETVKALPTIIEGIRAKGLKIVPLYELLGKTRADVMPPIPANQRWAASLTWIGFWLFDVGIKGITWIFFIGDLLMTGRLLFVGAFAIYDRLRHRQYGTPAEVEAYKPRVAVLIPAYNEEKVIERTIRAALASTYHNLRVIVIDDGSSDATLEVARECFPCATRLRASCLILTKPNAGKAEALNFGLGASDRRRDFCRHRCRHGDRARTRSRGWCRTS